MKIQLELGQKSHLRHFTTIVSEFERRGHNVIQTATTQDCPGLKKMRIADGDHRNLMAFDAYVRDDEWGALAYLIRTARDYLLYMKSIHVHSLTIKERICNMLTIGVGQLPKGIGARFRTLLERLGHDDGAVESINEMLSVIEDLIPPHRPVVEYLQSIDADIICVTPYIVTQYGQTDLVKAARHLGIPVVFVVGSWDNLSSKGAVQVTPDYTFVWNRIQREEAVTQHGISESSIRLVGAARFDDFWERRIEIPRHDYISMFGLDPAQPVITYLGSSNLISGDEREFVSRWIDGLRVCGDPNLINANVLLRPHPKFAQGWKDTFGNISGVGVVLSQGSMVGAMNNDRELFHSLIHSDVVVGANTSAELEAGILGRPIFTIEDEYFETGQSGTLHFRYLAGPLAKVSKSLDEHYQQISTCLAQPPEIQLNDAFLLDFLRPAGLEHRASKITVMAFESLVNSEVANPEAIQDTVKLPTNVSWINRVVDRICRIGNRHEN